MRRLLTATNAITDSSHVMLKSKVNIKVNQNKLSMENVYQDTNEKQAIVTRFSVINYPFQEHSTVVAIEYLCDTSQQQLQQPLEVLTFRQFEFIATAGEAKQELLRAHAKLGLC